MLAYGAAAETVAARPPREISRGVKRLALLYIWITLASSAIVFSEPALYDVLMVGAIVVLPLAGLAPVTRGLALYLALLTLIVAGGLIATTQAGVLNVPAGHVGITLYLALSSVVMAAFFSGRARLSQAPREKLSRVPKRRIGAASAHGVRAIPS
jgi:hypothetical protein